MKRRLLSLVALAVLAPTVAYGDPCTSASAQCTEYIVLGGGPGRSLVYRSYPLDTRNDAITRVLVMVHGAGRNADGYFTSAMAAAFLAGALENTLVIAPRMASKDGAGCSDSLGPNEISWNCGSWRSGGLSLTHRGVTSFDFIDELLRKVARKEVFPNLRAIVIAGHSAGGQVANRYAMTNQVHDKLGVPVSYVVSNPSSFAWPSDERPSAAAWTLTANPPGYIPEVREGARTFNSLGRDGRGCTTYNQWPFGLENRSGYSAAQSDEQMKRQLASRPTTYLAGELDILPLYG
jgi:pimeloyl-ACP methyl ester carboxylesterase